MKDKKKIIIGGIVVLVLCIGIGCGYLVSRNGGIEELLDGTPLSEILDKDSKDDDSELEDGLDADAAGAGGAGDAGAAGNGTTKTGYVDNGGSQVSGTSASNSYSIKMSDLCTFSDPSGISFDRRYVLHGGSDCMPAKRATNPKEGYSCKEAYVVLYAKGGKAAGEYVCYVMSSEAEAKKYASVLAKSGYSGGGMSCGNWGDVTYVYSSGSYVQTSINTYYSNGAIKSATPEAYLAMSFYFGGMSEYKPSASSNGGNGTSNPGNPVTPNNPSNPNNPNTPDTPNTPDNPNIPDNPDTPDNPSVSDEKSIEVTAEQLTDKIEEAKATKKNTYQIAVTDKYTFKDPEGLEYDERYVLYGGSDCGGVVAAGQNGAETYSAYEVFYLKDGQLVEAYRCYDAKSEADAKQVKSAFGPIGEVDIQGRVACIKMHIAFVQQYIEYYAQNGYSEEATPKAYMQAMVSMENYKFFKNPNPAEDPNPPVPPVTELKGTTQDEAFAVKLSDSYTYDESQVLPPTFEYDVRYVLYGDETCGYAVQCKATGFYEILYCADGKALNEIKAYVMADSEAAGALAQQLVAGGMYAVAMPNTNVVLAIDSNVQSMIDDYAEYGVLSEATPEAYLDKMFVELGGMEEITSSPSTSGESEDLSASMARVAEKVGIEPKTEESELVEAAKAAGIKPETEESVLVKDMEESESESEEELTEEEFDPATAGTVEEVEEKPETPVEEAIDPAVAGNTVVETVPESAPEAALAEEFDPATAGNTEVPAAPEETAAASVQEPNPTDIQMTSDDTYSDPEGLQYDKRYVLHGDKNSQLAIQLTTRNHAEVTEVYEIFYIKDGNVVAEYQCFIIGGRVTCNETKAEELQAMLHNLPSTEQGYEANPDGYLKFMEEVNGLVDVDKK